MAHVRQQIRAAVVTALLAANTEAEQEVFQSQVYELEEDKLPIITVRTEAETSEPLALGSPGTIERMVELVVTATAQDEERELMNTLDTLAAQIEAVLGGSTLSGLCKRINLTETTTERTSEASRPTGSVSLTFEALYVTDHNDGESAL